MKISCDIITDLLPLYYDGVCTESSKMLVEEHLLECNLCSNVLERIKDNSVDNFLHEERKEVVRHHTQTVKRKSFVTGISLASIMAIPVLVCLIVNLTTGHALDWFFIVLTALMTFASVTVVPLIVEKEKGLWTLGSFTLSLTLLLLSCAIYSGGDWFFVAVIPVLFGLSLLFTPYVMSRLPLGGFASRNRGLLVMAIDTVLLYAVIIISGVYTGGTFVSYFQTALSVTPVCLLLPWGLFIIIRYVKANIPIRAGLSSVFCGLYFSFGLGILDWILDGTVPYRFGGANLLVWNDSTINPNIFLLFLIMGCLIGGILIVIGLLRKNTYTSIRKGN